MGTIPCGFLSARLFCCFLTLTADFALLDLVFPTDDFRFDAMGVFAVENRDSLAGLIKFEMALISSLLKHDKMWLLISCSLVSAVQNDAAQTGQDILEDAVDLLRRGRDDDTPAGRVCSPVSGVVPSVFIPVQGEQASKQQVQASTSFSWGMGRELSSLSSAVSCCYNDYLSFSEQHFLSDPIYY